MGNENLKRADLALTSFEEYGKDLEDLETCFINLGYFVENIWIDDDYAYRLRCKVEDAINDLTLRINELVIERDEGIDRNKELLEQEGRYE